MVAGIISYMRITFIAVCLVAFLFVSPTILLAADGSSSEVDFVELYAKIIKAVDTGNLDRSIGKKARSFNSALQKEINAADTRLEALKTDVLKLEGGERDALLDELIAAGAEKERIYLDYHQRLEQLVNPDKMKAATAISTPVVQATDGAPKNEARPEESKARSRTMIFTSAPEDLTDGDFD